MSRELAAVLGAMSEPDGQAARLRFGTVTSVSPLRVNVGAGGEGLPVARLTSAYPSPAVGHRVVLLQQGKQMLCIGVYVVSE